MINKEEMRRLSNELTVLRGDIEVKHEEIRISNAELVRMIKRRDEILRDLATERQRETIGALD